MVLFLVMFVKVMLGSEDMTLNLTDFIVEYHKKGGHIIKLVRKNDGSMGK